MKTNKVTLLIALLLIGASYANAQQTWDVKMEGKSLRTIEIFKEKSWEMKSIFKNAYGYAVFPSIGKGGIVVGGAHGKGILYEQGKAVGDAKMTQVSVGFQWGGQSYSEIIFFEDKEALELFRTNRLELAAQASAVAVTAGISKDIPYNNGVAIYTLPKAGLMYEATVGGQKFKYSEQESD
jgi:lipid-binding SYLF domain-containing protein